MTASSVTLKIILSNMVVTALVATYFSSGNQATNETVGLKGTRKLQVPQFPIVDFNPSGADSVATVAAAFASINQFNPKTNLPGAFNLDIKSQVEGVLSAVNESGSGTTAALLPQQIAAANSAVGAVGAGKFIIPKNLGSGSISNSLPRPSIAPDVPALELVVDKTASAILALAP
jgi:hypothetical protein